MLTSGLFHTEGFFSKLRQFRQSIHKEPEIGFETTNTLKRIKDFLKSENIEGFDTETAKGSGLLLIEGTRPGPTIALRADIDALPIREISSVEWKSTNSFAHSCGHDGHQSWLIGVGAYFAKNRDFPGRILCVFQAAEESVNGAQSIIDTGVFGKYNVKEIYGAHNDPTLPLGKIGILAGPMMASCDRFSIVLQGKGTHGANPHLGIDPLPAANEIYFGLQTLVSRTIDANDCAVISVCGFNAGGDNTYNIVPAEVKMLGTVRTFKESVRLKIEHEMSRRVKKIAEAFDIEGETDYQRLTGAVVNDEQCTEFVEDVSCELLGKDSIVKLQKPYMISEDFGAYQQIMPGCFFMIGTQDEEHPHALHSPFFDFNDRVLPEAVALFISITKKRLEFLAS